MMSFTCDLQSDKDCRSSQFEKALLKLAEHYCGMIYDENLLLTAAILFISVMVNIFVLFQC